MGRSEHFAEGAQPHYRDTDPEPVEKYGMRRVQGAEVPKEFMAHHAILGPDADKHGTAWVGAPTEIIPPDVEVKTTQEYVGRAHVERYMKGRKPGIARPVDYGAHEDEGRRQGEGNPRVAKIGGEYWGVDGHHRLAAARALQRPVKARVYDVDQAMKNQFTAGPPPRTRSDVVDHLVEGHVRDNEMVTSDHHDPEHGYYRADEYGPAMDGRQSTSDLHSYHASLHEGGVADHHHS